MSGLRPRFAAMSIIVGAKKRPQKGRKDNGCRLLTLARGQYFNLQGSAQKDDLDLERSLYTLTHIPLPFCKPAPPSMSLYHPSSFRCWFVG